jgi:hypothetical protein
MSSTGWILIALVGLALFGFAMFEMGKKRTEKNHPSQTSNYSNRGTNEPNQENASDGSDEEKTDDSGVLSFAEKHSGLFLVIVTALLTLMTGFLWNATKSLVRSSERIGNRQVEEMRKSADAATKAAKAAEASITFAEENAHLDQRAWVAFINVSGTPVVDSSLSVAVKVKNSGKTFAKNLRMYVYFQETKEGGKPDFSEDETSHSGGSVFLLAPNGEYESKTDVFSGITETGKVTQGQIDDWKTGKKNFFVCAKLTYDDIFGCSHWTTLCNYLSRDLQYRAYREHNDADDNRCL